MRTTDRWAGWLRVLGVLLVCTVASAWWLSHRVQAYSERMLLRLGDHMLRYSGAHHQTAPEELLINGATFFISTGSVDAPVPEVLDNFQARCQEGNGRLHEQWAHAARQRHVKLRDYASILNGVYRVQSEHAGVIACAETGRDQLPPDELLARVRAAVSTGDISKLGKLRYVYVTQDQPQAAFVALWSEGELNVRTMFPRTGDAPGQDFPGIPRPAGSRRVLSAQPKGAPAALNMYATKERADALVAFYGASLPKAGYRLLTEKRGSTYPAAEQARVRFIAADNGERTLTISLQDDARSGHGLATVATQPD